MCCYMNCNSHEPPGDWRNELQCVLQLPEGSRSQEEVEGAALEHIAVK